MSAISHDFPNEVVCMRSIMSVKQKLEEMGHLESVLSTNLDYAERVLRDKLHNRHATLLVKGDRLLVQIGSGKRVTFTVTSENGHCQLHCLINCEKAVYEKDIESIHFIGHHCQNEIKSCFEQARESVPSSGLEIISVICNNLSLTYSLPYYGQKISADVVTVRPKCQLVIPEGFIVKSLLEKKCWVEREKAGNKGLQACIKYLIQQYLTLPDAPTRDFTFILQSDGEMVELETKVTKAPKLCTVMYDAGTVSMFPPTWQ